MTDLQHAQVFKMDGTEHCGILFSANPNRQKLTYAMFSAVVIVLILAAVLSEQYRYRCILIAVVTVVILALSIRNATRGELGIAIVDQGVIWGQIMGGTYFVPWNQLAEVATIQKPKGKPPTQIGLRVHNPIVVGRTSSEVTNLESWRLMYGWHLVYESVHILAPLEDVSQTIQYYLNTPEARQELKQT